MGGGASKIQGAVRDDIRKKDSRRLGMTIRSQLFDQFCHINGKPGKAPLMIFGSDSTEEMLAMVSLVKSLFEAGFEPTALKTSLNASVSGFAERRKPLHSHSQHHHYRQRRIMTRYCHRRLISLNRSPADTRL